MRPIFQLLDPGLVRRIVDEALQLLGRPGVKVEEPEAIRILVHGGATADGERVRIPEAMVQGALDSAHAPAGRPSATARASSTSTRGPRVSRCSIRRRSRPASRRPLTSPA